MGLEQRLSDDDDVRGTAMTRRGLVATQLKVLLSESQTNLILSEEWLVKKSNFLMQ